MAKKQKGSSNYAKLQVKIQKLHSKIKNQRNDFLQQESTRLVRKYDVIAVEDIDLRAIGGALKLGKNLHDNGFGMFRTMLTYKLEQKAHALLKLTDGLLLLKHAVITDMFRKSILMNVHMFVKNEGSLLTETGMLQSTSEKKENVSS